jgi:hypothetical protein
LNVLRSTAPTAAVAAQAVERAVVGTVRGADGLSRTFTLLLR